MDPFTLHVLAGHTDMKTMKRYVHPSDTSFWATALQHSPERCYVAMSAESPPVGPKHVAVSRPSATCTSKEGTFDAFAVGLRDGFLGDLFRRLWHQFAFTVRGPEEPGPSTTLGFQRESTHLG
jgi:hypothetical protein